MKFLDLDGVQAFKAYNDSVYITAEDVDTVDPVPRDTYTKDEIDENNEVISAALNDLNSRIEDTESSIENVVNTIGETEIPSVYHLDGVDYYSENKELYLTSYPQWANIVDKPTVRTSIRTASSASNTDIVSEKAISSALSAKEATSNKVTSLSNSSTNTQYPSAKCVYDALQTKLGQDEEQVIASALNALNANKENVSNKVTSISSTSTDNQYPSALAVYEALQDAAGGGDENVIEDITFNGSSVPISNKTAQITGQAALVSGVNIKTINNESILGSGNITITGGGMGEENVIETVKVNGTALTPDANKAVDISVPAQITSSELVGSMNRTDVSGSGNLTVKNTSGTFPTVAAGTYVVKTFADSSTSSYTLSISFGGQTYSLTSSDGIINDSRELTFSSSATWSGSITTVNSSTTLIVKVYTVESIVTTVGLTAVSNDYDDLDNKPTIPTESIVSGWGFTKNTGTYSKPSGGIPSTDLDSAVQASLDKADSAYQYPSGGIPKVNLSSGVKVSLGKADTAIQSVKVNGTALTPDANNAVDVTVPTDSTVSGWGYIKTFTETDPTVPSWAKASSKPTYTASEVGALPDTTSIPDESTVSGWGFTKNSGTVTGVKMNGTTKTPTSGTVDLGTVITSETSLSKGTTTGSGNAVTDISVSGHQITLTKGSTFLTSETSLSKGTTTGSGNAVTDISVSGHKITLTKGTTFLTSHQDISGKANLSGAAFTGAVTGTSSGNTAQFRNVTISSSEPTSSQGSNGDIWIVI